MAQGSKRLPDTFPLRLSLGLLEAPLRTESLNDSRSSQGAGVLNGLKQTQLAPVSVAVLTFQPIASPLFAKARKRAKPRNSASRLAAGVAEAHPVAPFGELKVEAVEQGVGGARHLSIPLATLHTPFSH